MARTRKWLSRARTNNELRGLNPLLAKWVEVVKEFCESSNFTDNPWWYNERASLSTLAGAAWRLKGWRALEEFSTSKRGHAPGDGISSGQVKRGRCDLYVSHKSHDFGIEAKQAWQSMGSKARKDHIAEAMKKAKRDAGNLTKDEADKRIGVVFTALTLPRAAFATKVGKEFRINRTKVQQAAEDWLKKRKLGKFHAHAYVVARRCDHFVSEYGSPRIFAGVLLTVCICKTGTKHPRLTSTK